MAARVDVPCRVVSCHAPTRLSIASRVVISHDGQANDVYGENIATRIRRNRGGLATRRPPPSLARSLNDVKVGARVHVPPACFSPWLLRSAHRGDEGRHSSRRSTHTSTSCSSPLSTSTPWSARHIGARGRRARHHRADGGIYRDALASTFPASSVARIPSEAVKSKRASQLATLFLKMSSGADARFSLVPSLSISLSLSYALLLRVSPPPPNAGIIFLGDHTRSLLPNEIDRDDRECARCWREQGGGLGDRRKSRDT